MNPAETLKVHIDADLPAKLLSGRWRAVLLSMRSTKVYVLMELALRKRTKREGLAPEPADLPLTQAASGELETAMSSKKIWPRFPLLMKTASGAPEEAVSTRKV